MNSFTKISSLLILIFIIGCTPQQLTEDVNQPTTTPTVNLPLSSITNTPLPTVTNVSATEISTTPQPSVTITAVNGNLYIRRGPGTKYNRIGVITKGTSAEVIARDVLSKWVQIKIPNSELTGWVSIQTEFDRIEGDLSQVPDFTFTDFPVAAYIVNCTEHALFIEPGEYYLENVFTSGQYLNEVRVDSGVYSVFDATLPDLPLIQTLDMQEGETAFVTVLSSGETHKCP